MCANGSEIATRIKSYALSLGFDACGIAPAQPVKEEMANRLRQWIGSGSNADLTYMARHYEKRCDPTRLVEGAQSVIVTALNYYPQELRHPSLPYIAAYAYGKDYHTVMREKLQQLYHYLQQLDAKTEGRCFCDTAPLLERYWAQQAGIGFVGEHTQLILPEQGSYFFIGCLVVTNRLTADTPSTERCHGCGRCRERCPMGALTGPYTLDARRCISYLTIEHRGEIAPSLAAGIGNHLYGCDVCQAFCPHNVGVTPHHTTDFVPSSTMLHMHREEAERLTQKEFDTLFGESAIQRTTYTGWKRNLQHLPNKKREENR